MSKRKTYLPRELRAGRTVFIVTSRRDGLGRTHYQVATHLIAGKGEPQPESMGRHPYRMHPAMARWAESRMDSSDGREQCLIQHLTGMPFAPSTVLASCRTSCWARSMV